MIETRRKDTGEVIVVKYIERCCRTCEHYGFAPDGCGDCDLLVEYDEEGKLMMRDEWNGEKLGSVPSHPLVGDSQVCDLWTEKKETQNEDGGATGETQETCG